MTVEECTSIKLQRDVAMLHAAETLLPLLVLLFEEGATMICPPHQIAD